MIQEEMMQDMDFCGTWSLGIAITLLIFLIMAIIGSRNVLMVSGQILHHGHLAIISTREIYPTFYSSENTEMNTILSSTIK